jgi:Carboxypeptidase regulatory-like domain/TonB dependent receptor
MRKHLRYWFAPLSFILLLILISLALAQGERGTFNGIVTDPTGAVVPNAEVIALNKETNVETRTMTTDAGVYRMPYLPMGTYKISVRASGFQTSVADNITLRVAQTLTVDIKLQAGQVSDSVTVSASTPLLESSTAEIGRYVSKQEFDTWPVAVGDGHRQIQTFIFSSLPGTKGDTFQGSINGGQYYSHEILIEGIPLGRFDLQGGSNNEFSPSADAVSEFKLQTGTIGAQYGGGQTSVANFAIRSGTNELHGTGFTYIQNEILRANSFSNKSFGTDSSGNEIRPRAPYKLLNYGFGLGGPVILPKKFFGPLGYNGRNKTFFFTNMEITRVRDFVSTGLTTLPTVDFKQGNFSKLLDPNFTGNPLSGTVVDKDALGRPVIFGQLYDPRTARSVLDQEGNQVWVRDPFPGNIIPQSEWSAVSRNILNLAPITDPINNRMQLNYPAIAACCPVFDQRLYAAKVDHHFTEKHRVSAYYNHTYRLRNNSPNGRWGEPPNTPTGVYQLQYTPGRMVRVAYDWTISPNVINHAAIGYNRFGNLNQSVFIDQDWPSKIGLQNVDQTHFPILRFGGTPFQGGGIGAPDSSGIGRLGSGNAGGSYNGSTIFMNDLTIIRGSHNFKTGFELRKYYYNIRNRSGSGNFLFNPVQTGLPGFAESTGHSFASFLLGAVNDASRGIAAANFGYRVTQPGFYFMDDWKVSQKLTLNLGLRWEIIGGFNEVAGRESGIDFNKPNPGAGNRLGALVFADEMGRKGFQDPYYYMISPRVGFAYAVNNKLVVRGGYGINNTPFISNGFGGPGTLGYNGNIPVNSASVALLYPQAPVMYLHDPFPSFSGTLPNRNPALANNQGIGYVAPDSNRVAYVQNYNLGFQYLLPASLVIEVSYIGNKGTRLEAGGLDNLNQLPLSALAYGDNLIKNLSATPGLVPLPYPGFTGTVAQALRPYPQYTNIGQTFANFGTSNYNSLQVSLTRHLTRGLAIMGAYTWSKAITLGSDSAIDSPASQNVYQRDLERSITSFSTPHVFKLTWILDLPIGKGRRWNPGRALGHIIGGWTLTGIHNYSSGDPLSISATGPLTVLFNGTVRPDWNSGVPVIVNSDADVKTDGKGESYLNRKAFDKVPVTGNNVPLRLGTAPPRLPGIFGPGIYSENFGLKKSFSFTEESRLEFRIDMFNAFNRAGRGNPVTDFSNDLFGKITGARFGPRNMQFEARIVF